MKSLFKLIGKRRTIIFLDLEGTQFSHEMIAFGAVRADLDKNYRIKKIHKGIKYYVKAKNKIGNYVSELTGIHQDILDKKGITYKEALKKIRKYCGYFLSRVVFMTFGTHDLRILMKSLEQSPDADHDFCNFMVKNSIDLSMVLSQFIRDENANPLSLLNCLNVFHIDLVGEPHDPLTDAKHLMLVYQAMLEQKDVVFDEYKKLLMHYKTIPDPVKKTIKELMDGKDVSSEEFITSLHEYIG